jgi:two-component system NtrC family sensor kinase
VAALARFKLVGEDPELDRVEAVAQAGGFPFRRFADLEEACESHEDDPAELFIVGPSLYFQSHLNQIQRLESRPAVMLATGARLPNLAKIMIPRLVYNDWGDDEIIWEIQLAAEFHRRQKRLDALRDHQKRSWSVESNPAIQLVTSLMRKCTAAEEYRDLLDAVLGLRSVIEFHDASLLILNGEGNAVETWHCPKESRDRLETLNLKDPSSALSKLPEGEVTLFSSSGSNTQDWERLTRHPWSFGISIRFSLGQGPKGPRGVRSGVLVLYRRELVPFVERDYWLLEMTYGPLALALEKVVMLKAIGQASKEWRSTFDGISEPLTVIDSSYQIVKANKAFASLVETDIKKLKGKRCYTLLANRRTPCIGCPVGHETQPSSGTRIQALGKNKKDLLAWSYGIRTGLESYHFQFYRNVSKETALASQLIQSEKMAALGKLVGAVAHEINNPLAGILATSQIVLGEEGTLDASTREDFEEIRSAAWRSKKIIDDLLGFTSNPEQQVEEANLLEAVQSALTFSKSALREVAVKVNCPEIVPRAAVPLSALQQVLFNLITNAAHAMNGKGSLTLDIASGEGHHEIKVRDSGPGIPSEKLKTIFDPFFTSKQEGQGTGLGLSIVRSLTQKMNARIEVSSEAGKGTEFRIQLPVSHEGDE